MMTSCSLCYWRETCNLDGLTAKSCGIFRPKPNHPGDCILAASKSLNHATKLLLRDSVELSNRLVELRAQRAERQRGR